MNRAVLIQKYRRIEEQAAEDTAEWRVYSLAARLLEGAGDLDSIISEARTERKDCKKHAENYPDLLDDRYGTYAAYMQAKAELWQDVIIDLVTCKYEELMVSAERKRDGRYFLYQAIVAYLERYPVPRVIQRLQELVAAHTCRESSFQKEPRIRKRVRRAAFIYAQAALDLMVEPEPLEKSSGKPEME